MSVFSCYVSDKGSVCLLFYCNGSDKRTRYLYYIVTLKISAHSCLCSIVTLVRRALYICSSSLR